MDAKKLEDEIWGVHSQWWCDMLPCGYTKDTKLGVMGHHNFKDETLIKDDKHVKKWMWQARSSRTKINKVIVETCFGLL